MRKLDCFGVTGNVGKISEEVIPAASAGYAIPRDSEENLLLDTLARIRIATGLIKPMLTELPGEVRILMNELRDLRAVAHRSLELYERWESEHDPDACQFAEWDGLKEALKSAGVLPA